MTAAAASAGHQRPPGRRRGGRGSLAWVTWREHRAGLAGPVAALGLVAVVLAVTGPQIHARFARLGGAAFQNATVYGYYGWHSQLTVALQVFPALTGMLLGAPLLAREFETGTCRFAWTQGTGRVRWAAVKLTGPAVAVTAAAALFGLLFSWWNKPFETVNGRWPIQVFDLQPAAFAGWTLLSFTLGVFLGTLLRRTLPAIGATLAGYALLAYLTATRLRPAYWAPLTGPAAHLRDADDIGGEFAAWPGGRPVSGADLLKSQAWYTRHHITTWAVYQPASRYGSFQAAESAGLLAAALLLAAATLWLVWYRDAGSGA